MNTSLLTIALCGAAFALGSARAEDSYRWTTLFVGKRFVMEDGKDQPASPLAGIAVDAVGNVYVSEGKKHTIVRITPDGKAILVAGRAGSSGTQDGNGPAARFNNPQGLVVDDGGNLYVTDQNNHTIRKITAAGVVTTLAGSPGHDGREDGRAGDARFKLPGGIGMDGHGNIFVGDVSNHAIRKITPDGVISTVAGVPPERNSAGAGSFASAPGDIGMPGGLAVDNRGNVYYVRHMRSIIQKLTPDGVIQTVGGVDERVSTTVDGPSGVARLHRPFGLAVDAEGNAFMADCNTVRKMTPDGDVTTIGGLAQAPGTTTPMDGVGPAARFPYIRGVAVSHSGVVYVTSGTAVIQGTPLP